MSRKEEIITGLIEARKRIIDLSAGLQPDKQDQVFLGIWSIKDLPAHLIGWDFTNIEAVKDIRAGQAPRVFKRCGILIGSTTMLSWSSDTSENVGRKYLMP